MKSVPPIVWVLYAVMMGAVVVVVLALGETSVRTERVWAVTRNVLRNNVATMGVAEAAEIVPVDNRAAWACAKRFRDAPRAASEKPAGMTDVAEAAETVLRAVRASVVSVRRIPNAFPIASGRIVVKTDAAPCAGSAGRGRNA